MHVLGKLGYHTVPQGKTQFIPRNLMIQQNPPPRRGIPLSKTADILKEPAFSRARRTYDTQDISPVQGQV
jgi:hypothetical protein